MRVVLFDLGGVLIRISRSFEEAAQRAGVTLPGSQPESAGSLIRPRGNQANMQRGLIEYDEFLANDAKRLDGQVSTEDLHRIHMEWTQGEYEGVTEIVHRLNAAGIHTGALSNTDAEHWKTLSETPVIKALDTYVLSFRLGLIKPSPEIYHAAEDLVDATGPSICFLDDLAENVEAALRCGWNAMQIDPHEPTAPQIADALEAFGIEY